MPVFIRIKKVCKPGFDPLNSPTKELFSILYYLNSESNECL